MEMNHVMIDLETLGTKNTSVFLSVAAVQFSLDGKTGQEFYQNINLKSALDAGLTIDASTLEWWLTQRPEIMKLMFNDPKPLDDVLIDLASFIRNYEIQYPWGNSVSFDLGILGNGFNKAGHEIPWKFYNERCYRTIVEMSGIVKDPKPSDAHNPLSDCHYQIKQLAKCKLLQ